jgi:hypothetical protein
MKWTCERCGLQRDDRRGSGCNGVQGQAHEWEETWWVIEKQKRNKWQIWLNSSDSKEWRNEFEKIRKTILDTVENVQKQCVQVIEKEKENYDKTLFEINSKTEEYNKKVEVYNKIRNENILLNENIVPLNYGIKKRLIIAGIGFGAILIIFKNTPIAIVFLSSIIIIPVIFRIYKNILNSIKIKKIISILNNLANELDKNNKEINQYNYNLQDTWKNYLKEIDKKYEAGIDGIIQKSKQMIQENNQKNNVTKDKYSFKEFELNFNENDFSIAYNIRKKIINDDEFKKKHLKNYI